MHHEELARRIERVAEALAIFEELAIDEDYHVLAQPPLIVEHVAAQRG